MTGNEMIKVKERIEHLMKIWKLYDALNIKTRGTYRWRQDAIDSQLNILWNIVEGQADEWEQIYKEDLEESNSGRC